METSKLRSFNMRVTVSHEEEATSVVPMEKLVVDWVADRAARNGYPFVVYCQKYSDDAEIFGCVYGRTYAVRLWVSEELTLP